MFSWHAWPLGGHLQNSSLLFHIHHKVIELSTHPMETFNEVLVFSWPSLFNIAKQPKTCEALFKNKNKKKKQKHLQTLGSASRGLHLKAVDHIHT